MDDIGNQLAFARALGIADAMQATRNAAAVFDGAGRLLCLNSLAQACVGDLFDVAQGALVFYDRASQSRFEALLGRALGDRFAPEPKPIVLYVRNREHGSVLIRAIGLLRRGQDFSASAKALILFGEPEPVGEDISRVLISSFGLTGAEGESPSKSGREARSLGPRRDSASVTRPRGRNCAQSSPRLTRVVSRRSPR